ncbi:hypothetical protein HPB48_000032 [Haemaphysalis longicornis]|uniref:Uncharacterized protein n=1 Tax=Haemaphysalis longicornis TaxID=44386 RepID=A0A9J6G787_HAELO|nr:hypothetical protein HPB48_000032 [Haemaphysalis longicornis]
MIKDASIFACIRTERGAEVRHFTLHDANSVPVETNQVLGDVTVKQDKERVWCRFSMPVRVAGSDLTGHLHQLYFWGQANVTTGQIELRPPYKRSNGTIQPVPILLSSLTSATRVRTAKSPGSRTARYPGASVRAGHRCRRVQSHADQPQLDLRVVSAQSCVPVVRTLNESRWCLRASPDYVWECGFINIASWTLVGISLWVYAAEQFGWSSPPESRALSLRLSSHLPNHVMFTALPPHWTAGFPRDPCRALAAERGERRLLSGPRGLPRLPPSPHSSFLKTDATLVEKGRQRSDFAKTLDFVTLDFGDRGEQLA